ncbi:MAG: hypothetical protein Q9163_005146 [Psora crenata]
MRGLPDGELYRTWVEEVPNEGLIRYLDIFNSERILVVSPKALAELLVQKPYEFIKPPQLFSALVRFLGVGVALAEGDEHKRQRKDLLPAFAFRNVKEMYPIFWDKSRLLVQAIIESVVNAEKVISDKTAIDISEWASRTTLDIIGTAGFGHEFRSIEDQNNDLIQAYKWIFSPHRSHQLLDILSFYFPNWLIRAFPHASIKQNDDMEAAVNVIKSTCFDILQQNKQKLDKRTAPKNIISVAIESGGFSEEDLVNQLMTFLAAGHETTATALCWAICMLCKYPEVQTQLQREVRSALPDPRNSDLTISASDIDSLPYLNAVCNEVLRLLPPGPRQARVSANNTTLLGHFIPKNTSIVLPAWAVNTSAALWGDDAKEFNPGRWLGKGKSNGGAASNYANLTFMHGPRSCIAQSFAKGELACLMAAWARTFDTAFAKANYVIEVQNGITMKPKDLQVTVDVLKLP